MKTAPLKIFIMLLLAPSLLLSFPKASHSMVTDIGVITAAAIGRETVGDILDEADSLIQRAGQQAEASAATIINHGSYQLKMLLSNAENVLDGQRRELVKDLSAEAQQLVVAVKQESRRLEQMTDDIISFGDGALISLEGAISDSLLGVFSKKKIVLQRLSGLSVLERERPQGSITLKMIASEAGFGTDEIKSQITVFVDGIAVPVELTPTTRHSTSIKIPFEYVAQKFAATRTTTVPISIEIKQERRRFFGSKTVSQIFPSRLALYPRYAGVFEASYMEPKLEWVPIDERLSKQSQGECHGCNIPYTLTITVEGDKEGNASNGDKRISNYSCTCASATGDGGACWYDQNINNGITANISEDKSQVQCVGGHRSARTIHTLSAGLDQYTFIENTTQKASHNVYFGRSFTVRMPSAGTGFLRLKGRLTTGGDIDVSLDPVDASRQPVNINIVGPETIGNEKIYQISLSAPSS